jgi:hypothetical protein
LSLYFVSETLIQAHNNFFILNFFIVYHLSIVIVFYYRPYSICDGQTKSTRAFSELFFSAISTFKPVIYFDSVDHQSEEEGSSEFEEKDHPCNTQISPLTVDLSTILLSVFD